MVIRSTGVAEVRGVTEVQGGCAGFTGSRGFTGSDFLEKYEIITGAIGLRPCARHRELCFSK